MCTAIFYKGGDRYFGRTLDLEYSYNERVTVTKRNFPFVFRHTKPLEHHYAIVGMATVEEGYPLYYDAANEMGLAMAGLNFPKSAYFPPHREGKLNLAPFELIPYILGRYKSVCEVENAFEKINVCNTAFSERFAAAPLHFIIADKSRSIVLESRIDGLHIFENGANVLTNEPSFENQLANLANFAKLTGDEPPAKEGITPVSRGLGAFGLPGDYSSPSRFVRAAFLLENADRGEDITQFFRILGSVEVPCGAVRLKDGKRVITHYTSCINLSGGIYFYKTYTNSRISGVDMRKEELDGCDIVSYPLIKTQDILMQN